MTTTAIIVLILLCLSPAAYILWLCRCDDKRQRAIKAEMLAWDERRKHTPTPNETELFDLNPSTARRLGNGSSPNIITPAVFPATREEREDLEEALPGYKFVAPVTDAAFNNAVLGRPARKPYQPAARTVSAPVRARKRSDGMDSIVTPTFMPSVDYGGSAPSVSSSSASDFSGGGGGFDGGGASGSFD
jgi:hypothetical protein